MPILAAICICTLTPRKTHIREEYETAVFYPNFSSSQSLQRSCSECSTSKKCPSYHKKKKKKMWIHIPNSYHLSFRQVLGWSNSTKLTGSYTVMPHFMQQSHLYMMMLLFQCIVKQVLSSRQNKALRKPYYFKLLISQPVQMLLASELISATSLAT